MSKSRVEQMVDRLRNMQVTAPDIEPLRSFQWMGLIMASALQQGVEEDRVSAMSAAMLSLGERISNELGRKAWSRSIFTGGVVSSVGKGVTAAALGYCSSSADLKSRCKTGPLHQRRPWHHESLPAW
jgi:uncharacterized protein